MDYSKLSDYEVSKLVAMAIGGFLEEDFCDTHSVIFKHHGRYQYSFFEPCTNPSDAWPIIEKYRISFLDQLTEWCVDAKGVSPVFEANPLRGAMIVFLMMQDSANVQDNTA